MPFNWADTATLTAPVEVTIGGASRWTASPGAAFAAPSAACADCKVVASKAALGRLDRATGTAPGGAIGVGRPKGRAEAADGRGGDGDADGLAGAGGEGANPDCAIEPRTSRS